MKVLFAKGSNTTAIPGDFGAKVTGMVGDSLVLALPEDIYRVLVDAKLTEFEQIPSYIGHMPGYVANSLGWNKSQVLDALEHLTQYFASLPTWLTQPKSAWPH